MRAVPTNARTVLITGGSTGIGLACARHFVRHGWNVSVFALPGPELNALTGEVLTTPGDITNQDARERAVERTVRRFDRIDVLVNNAGVGLYSLPSNVPIDLFSRVLDVNVIGALALSQSVIPVMRRQRRGTIVNMLSVAARVSLPWAAAYCASKFALNAVHDALRRELHRDGIRLVKICPGIVATDFRKHVLAGVPPSGVSSIRWVVTPEAVAASVFRAVERGRGTVYLPWVARFFTLLETVAPSLMDLYLERFLSTEAPAMREAVAAGYSGDLSSEAE